MVVRPVVRLFFPCDKAVLDAEEKWTLTNPWHTVAMPPGITGKFCQEEIWLYSQFSGGVGSFNLSVELRNELGATVGRSKPIRREFLGGTVSIEEVFHLTRVPFDEPGLYEFVLKANYLELEGGHAYLRVLPG